MITLAFLLSLANAPSAEAVYTPAQAVADVLSSPLEYVGRGGWFGMARWESCVYRNKRVLVVDIYCAKGWPEAFSVRVFSPKRGRIRLHIESQTAVTELTREQYDDTLWQIESEPPPSREALPTRLRLNMTFDEVRDYEEARYQLYLPACYTAGGEARCHKALPSATEPWAAAVMPFWRSPGKDWKRLITHVRALAVKHGT